MNRASFQLKFHLWGIPIQIHPFFWVAAFLFSPFLSGQFVDSRLMIAGLLGWTTAWTFSFLIHEMGHALIIKKRFGASPQILLYGFGGLTIHQPIYRHKLGYGGRILIAAAGPLSELLAVFLFLGFFYLRGVKIAASSSMGPIPIPLFFPHWIPLEGLDTPLAQVIQAFYLYFITGFIWMGTVWSVLNLLPIYPLDGGQIARFFFMKFQSTQGLRISLQISIAVAIALIAFSLMGGNYFISMFFGLFAYQNYQELTRKPS